MARNKLPRLPKTVVETARLSFEGNIIPHSWYRHVVLASGKPDLPAIIILAEIIYWYRPYEILDEKNGRPRYEKKFKGDMFQSAAGYYEQKFGLTKDQARKALKRLEDLGLIRRELREITQRGVKMNNVMFVEPVPAKIAKITYSELEPEDPGEDSGHVCATCGAPTEPPPSAEAKPEHKPGQSAALIFDYGLKDLNDKQREQISKHLAGVPDAQIILDELNSNVMEGRVKTRKPYISYLKTLINRATGKAVEPFEPTSDLPERRRKAAALQRAHDENERQARERLDQNQAKPAPKKKGPPGGSLKKMLEDAQQDS